MNKNRTYALISLGIFSIVGVILYFNLKNKKDKMYDNSSIDIYKKDETLSPKEQKLANRELKKSNRQSFRLFKKGKITVEDLQSIKKI